MARLLVRSNLALAGLAVALGLAAAFFPLPTLAIMGLSGLMIALYIEPMLGLALMLAVAPLKTLIETETAFPLDSGQIALMLFLGVWSLRRMMERQQHWTLPYVILGNMGVFILAAGLSLEGAPSPSAGLNELLKWVQIWLLVLILGQEKRPEWPLFALIFAALLQAILGLWQFRGGSGAAHLWILDYRYFRAFGTFGQPNPFGAFMGLILPLALGTTLGYLASALWDKSRRVSDGLLGLCLSGVTALLLMALLASWSRGAWLGFLGAAAMLIWAFPRRRWQGTLLIASGMTLLGVLWVLGWLPAGVTERLTGFGQDFTGMGDVRGVVITNDNYAVVERLAHWQSAIGMAQDHPWWGVGFGNYEAVYADYALINWPSALGHAHNYYLNLLAETGIIGLTAYLLMWGSIFALTFRILAQATLSWVQRGMAAGLLGSWTHIAIHSLLDKLYVNNLFLHIGALMGLLVILTVQGAYADTHKSH